MVLGPAGCSYQKMVQCGSKVVQTGQKSINTDISCELDHKTQLPHHCCVGFTQFVLLVTSLINSFVKTIQKYNLVMI